MWIIKVNLIYFRYNNNVKNINLSKYKNEFFVVSAVFVLILTILSFNFYKSPVPHSNLADTKISLYSNKNITPNAVVTNPEFKNIAFNTDIPKPSLFSSQMATVIRTIKSFTTSPTSEGPKEYGSWIWTPIMQMTPEYVESILSDVKADGINTIYVSVDSYLDIFVMPKGIEREKQKEIFSDILEDFIIKANYRGIAVDAEAGWQNWAEEGNTYKAFAIVNFVKDFNATHKNKFRGFQYDVEPYLLYSYQENKATVLKNFVSLVDQTEYFMNTDSLRFSVVVPDFYDEKDEFTPKFSYNGRRGYVFKHLLDILDRRPDSSIIVMSYRNFADGKDGAIEVSKNEIQTAGRGAYKTQIIIAQETGEVPPPYITFYNTPKRYFNWQIERINIAFESHSNFGGITVHYVNAFLALK